ncbi:MAG: hypothetical protein M0010_10385 [Actinomycetota bacterium]|nr:hypothetical protein [Actinomycetota bacterium]
MSEIRHGHRPRSRWAARLAATAAVLAAVLGIPAAAAAAAAPLPRPAVAWTARPGLLVRDRTGTATEPSPPDASTLLRQARTGAASGTAASERTRQATTTSARASSRAREQLATQLGQARRTDGRLGQWVVGVLLSILVVLWVVLVAIVVRARMRFTQSAAGQSPSGEGRAK